MGCCNGRCYLLNICVLQFVASVERQVFDFLGYMWAPIIGNFFQILCVILGFFGAYQCRPKYVIVYVLWAVLWIAWNAFVVCLYMGVGALKKEDNSILNMGTGSRSWWEVNGIGCNAKYNASSYNEYGVQTPIAVDHCLLNYQYVEVIHAGIQILLAIMGLIGASYLVHLFTSKDFSSHHRKNTPSLPYSIEYQQQTSQESQYQRPMTPRKVKRRSTRSKRGSTSRRHYQNPVTRIMDRSLPILAINDLAQQADSSTSNDSFNNNPPPSYSSAPPSYSSAASSMNIMGLEGADRLGAYGGFDNPSYQVQPRSQPNSRPTSTHNGRPSPIYMNHDHSETVI